MQHFSELFKLLARARYACAIWVCGVLVLTMRPTFLKLDGLAREFGTLVGGATLLAFVVWIIELWLLGIQKLNERRDKNRQKVRLINYLKTLSPSERRLLRTAVADGVQTLFGHRYDDETICSLVAKELIERSSATKEARPPCVIRPEVWQLLIKGGLDLAETNRSHKT